MRRSREQICASILKACAADKLAVSQLMATQNLSYKLLRSNLDRLVTAKLVEFEQDRNRTMVSTTHHGTNVLRCYRNAIALLNGDRAKCPLIPDTEDE